MAHQIDPDTDPIAACLLIFAKRGAAIRAEQERTIVAAQNAHEQIVEKEPTVKSHAQVNLDAIVPRDKLLADVDQSPV
jgi:hypothetical protein